MTKDELISKQQLELESYRLQLEDNERVLDILRLRFYAVGAPLNDNSLRFNDPQLKWCFKTFDLIEQINQDLWD